MTMKLSLALAAGCALVVGASEAKTDQTYEIFDLNHDKMISADEIISVRTWTFEQIDQNADGSIERSEVDDAVKQRILPRAAGRRDQFLTQRDMNRDGVLTIPEFTTVSVLFGQSDADKDGALNPNEVLDALDRFGPDALM